MQKDRKIKKIEDLIAQVDKLKDLDQDELHNIETRAKMILTKIFPNRGKDYSAEISEIQLYPLFYPIAPESEIKIWRSGKVKMLNFLKTRIEEIQMFSENGVVKKGIKYKKELSKKIFIVHGKDEEMKLAVAKVLEKLKLEPIILHEQPDKPDLRH